MSMFYAGRHRAPSTKTPQRTGASLVAVAAVGLGTAAATAPAASAAPATVSAPSAASISSASSATSTASFSGLVRRGARGYVVKQIQWRTGASADGVFGPLTESAVKRYQRRNGLVADGIVGPRTGTKMGLSSSRTTTTTSRTTTRTVAGSSLLSTAASLVGVPYRYGGTTTSGFDCSGFTQYVFARHGKSLPRTAEAQRQAATRVSSPRPGDLVFFGAPAYHMGIYAGNGQIYDAGSTPRAVTKRSLWTSAVSYGRF